MRFKSLFKHSVQRHPLLRFAEAFFEAMTADVTDVELLRDWAGM